MAPFGRGHRAPAPARPGSRGDRPVEYLAGRRDPDPEHARRGLLDWRGLRRKGLRRTRRLARPRIARPGRFAPRHPGHRYLWIGAHSAAPGPDARPGERLAPELYRASGFCDPRAP